MITDMNVLSKHMMDLVAMDAVVRNLNDEDILDIWLTHGLPDGATDAVQIGVLQSIAEDESEYMRIVNLYNELLYGSFDDNWC